MEFERDKENIKQKIQADFSFSERAKDRYLKYYYLLLYFFLVPF